MILKKRTFAGTPESHWKQLVAIWFILAIVPFLIFFRQSLFYTTLPKSFVYTGGWRESSVCKNPYRHQTYAVSIKSEDFNLYLFTHNPKEDLASRKLHQAVFLSDVPSLSITKSYLTIFKDIDYVIDIGAHVGAVTILASLMGKKVVAIDGNEENLRKLCSSLIYSKLQKNVVIVHGVAGVSHKPITWIYQTNGNHTGSYVDLTDDMWSEIRADSTWTFDARIPIMIDNLIEVLPNFLESNVFMNIDVNGYENVVLLGAHLFMMKAKIRGILTNFKSHKNKSSGRDIVQIIQKIDLHPFHYNGKTLINLENRELKEWSDLVLWL